MNTNKKLDAEMQLYSDIVKARHNVAHDNIEQHKIFREIKKALICNVPLLSRGDITEFVDEQSYLKNSHLPKQKNE